MINSEIIKFIAALSFVTMTSLPAFSGNFENFETEISEISTKINCSGKITKDEELPDLWGCIYPDAEVTKIFINESESGGVENVKIMWNDWTKDVGYGVHTNQSAAEELVASVSKIYAPDQVSDILAAFAGGRDITINNDLFSLSYTYSQGPAIDERLVTITKNN